MHLVDIDESDSEEGGGSCCEIYWLTLKRYLKAYSMIFRLSSILVYSSNEIKTNFNNPIFNR